MISLTNVTMSYTSSPVVRDVCLNLPESGMTALIGANGAGKSTLLSGIGRLHPLDAGDVCVDGVAVPEWKPRELAKRLAILRQENHLSVRLSVAELVALGRHPHSAGSLTSRDEEIVDDALRSVDMADLSHRFLDELSGGQRQRAFIAMTLAQDAHYLLLDEPLASLDLHHAREMMRHLRRICDERGVSVIIVLHDINTAATYADSLVAMRDGRVIAVGSPDEVMTPPTLADVFDVETTVVHVDGHPVAIARP
ncbi:ATP-binding cassette domain-containing protein [Nanchangia anserum]|uniref:ATP-binding cassette domain-containing protein n=1 Tax=Nanchangia anserum TaxID=2692125 RepID=A0A8I0KS37_9ACTO|nr:ATP-binding cassette domain-containing protein [Nanchangia anserum]MBD3690022.1 ATP-binding cassette domain-containing protein [Nanchangia anserum]QOX82181.1 ATP-binding cassette domain-containing protein [Nanchangia anserum]